MSGHRNNANVSIRTVKPLTTRPNYRIYKFAKTTEYKK